MAVFLVIASGAALATTLRTETTGPGIIISPQFTFIMPDAPASLAFISNTTLSHFYVGVSNLSLGDLGISVVQTPSTAPIIPMAVSTFSPETTSGDAIAWTSIISNASSVLFSFTGLLSGTRYTLGVDNASHGTFDGPSVGFVWASGGTHYFELAISNPPTLDTNAWTFLFLLVALVALWAIAIIKDRSWWLFPAGMITFLLALEAWTITASVYPSLSLVVVGIVTLYEAIPETGNG